MRVSPGLQRVSVAALSFHPWWFMAVFRVFFPLDTTGPTDLPGHREMDTGVPTVNLLPKIESR